MTESGNPKCEKLPEICITNPLAETADHFIDHGAAINILTPVRLLEAVQIHHLVNVFLDDRWRDMAAILNFQQHLLRHLDDFLLVRVHADLWGSYARVGMSGRLRTRSGY